MSYAVLIADRDVTHAHQIVLSLSNLGINSVGVANLDKLLEAITPTLKLLIIGLDVKYSTELEVLARVRHRSDASIIIQCDCNDSLERIIALEMGADDIISRTCNIRELAAKIRNILRRSYAPLIRSPSPSVIRFGVWALSPSTRELASNTGVRVALSLAGCAILRAFLKQPFVVISRGALSEKLNRKYSPNDRTIDINVCQLRKILGTQAEGRPYIKTLRSQGYVFLSNIEGINK